MREHALLFCLLGLVLTATIILVTAPGALTWALALIERASCLPPIVLKMIRMSLSPRSMTAPAFI